MKMTGLRHQPRLHAHGRVAHLALEFGLRNQRRYRVHNDDVHGIRANQRFSDFERLFAVVGLRHEKIVHVHAELFRVDRIERVLRINECGRAA